MTGAVVNDEHHLHTLISYHPLPFSASAPTYLEDKNVVRESAKSLSVLVSLAIMQFAIIVQHSNLLSTVDQL